MLGLTTSVNNADSKSAQAEAREMMRKAEKMMQEAKKLKESGGSSSSNGDHFEKKMQEALALKEHNEAILNKNKQIDMELKKASEEREKYKQDKETMAAQLKQYESMIIASSDKVQSEPDSSLELAKQQAERRRSQYHLNVKKKHDMQLEAAKAALLLEKQCIEEELKSTQEEARADVNAQKKRSTKYKLKLEAARDEIHDLTTEFQRERESLLDTIRDLSRENKLLDQVVEHFLQPNELISLWDKAKWDEDSESWKLPKFKSRLAFDQTSLPSLKGREGEKNKDEMKEYVGNASSSRSQKPPSASSEEYTFSTLVPLDSNRPASSKQDRKKKHKRKGKKHKDSPDAPESNRSKDENQLIESPKSSRSHGKRKGKQEAAQAVSEDPDRMPQLVMK